MTLEYYVLVSKQTKSALQARKALEIDQTHKSAAANYWCWPLGELIVDWVKWQAFDKREAFDSLNRQLTNRR